jgi:hypothetical protein
MALTPGRIRIKGAETARNVFVGSGLVSGLFSWAAFDDGAFGLGLCFAGGAVASMWIATKIRVWREKKGEAGVY